MGLIIDCVFILLGVVGLCLGFYMLYSVRERKQWIDNIIMPITFGGLMSKRVNIFLMGIIIIIFSGAFIFVVIQEAIH